MQDSLDDYLRISRNSGHDVPDRISQELVATAKIKQECDARAMKIVEFSIDGKLRPEVFSRCLPFINQSNYQDIVEERAMSKLCGYSICGKRIPEMPKKQYFISTKSNKVYDITERKNFCSNFCYKASVHIQNQIDNSPLWLRKLEDIPEYTYLHSSEAGLPGKYIEQGIVKPAHNVSFTSINTFAGMSLGDILDPGSTKAGKNKNSKTTSFKKSSMLKKTMQTIKENEIEEEIQLSLNESSKITTKRSEEKQTHKVSKKDNHHNHHKMSCLLSLPSIEENEEKALERLQTPKECENPVEIKENIQENCQENKNERVEHIVIDKLPPILMKELINTKQENSQTNIDATQNTIAEISFKKEPPERPIEPMEKPVGSAGNNLKTKNKKQTKKRANQTKPPVLDIEGVIRKTLDEWLTIETCIFIHGEQKVKQILSEKKLSDYFEELKVAELQREQQIKYMEICRRLQFREMAEDKFDSAVTDGGQKLKPLPDFKKLKAVTKNMTVKAKSFYEGTMYEQDDTNFPAQINQPDKGGGNPEENEGSPAVLPPVDVNSQNLLRRKIFLNSLNKSIQQLLQSLGLSYFSTVLSDIQALAKTFNLKADNIMFKPIVWSYVSLVLLSLLSLKDPSLKEILEERRSQEYMKILFETLPNKKNFIGDVLSNIQNIEKFVERYIISEGSNFV